MKLNQALNEYVEEIPLLKWNKHQALIWKSLISKGLVNKDDMQEFMKLAKFFDMFYRQKHHFPKVREVAVGLHLT